MNKKFYFLLYSVLFLGSHVEAQHPIDIERTAATGDYYKALALSLKIPERQYTASSLVAAGKSAWALSLPELANGEFDKALHGGKLDSTEQGRIFLSKGIIEYQEARYQSAILFAEKSIQALRTESSLRAQAWLLWAESLTRLGKPGLAEEKYRTALEEASPRDRYEINFLLGKCLIRLGKFGDAKEHLESIPIDSDRSAEAIRNLAIIAYESKDNETAKFWLLKGRELHPDDFLDSWVDYTLMVIAVNENRSDDVSKLRESASKKYPPSDPWFNLMDSAAEGFEWRKHNIISN